MRKKDWQPVVKMIYEVGIEQTLHFQQVFEVAKQLKLVDMGVELYHTRHGLYLNVDGKKFRTREGGVVKLEKVLDEAIDRAKKLGSETREGAKAVGIGAIKYFDLMHNVQSDIVFDWEKVMNMDGNSGPYLQYTYARTQSVLVKSQIPNPKSQINSNSQLPSYNPNKEELAILKWIYRFPEVVEEAAVRYSPNLVCNFLYELAQRFNTFYNQHSILSAGDDELIVFRLRLTTAVGEVMKNGLLMLGIQPLKKM